MFINNFIGWYLVRSILVQTLPKLFLIKKNNAILQNLLIKKGGPFFEKGGLVGLVNNGLSKVQVTRFSRKALRTTTSELAVMPMAASHGGTQPIAASGIAEILYASAQVRF